MDFEGMVGLWETDFPADEPSMNTAEKGVEELDINKEMPTDELEKVIQDEAPEPAKAVP